VLLFPVMTSLGLGDKTPQFGTAEYGSSSGGRCQFCQQPIGGSYFRVNDSMACASCADKMRGERDGDSHAAFVRGLTAGIGAAVAGLIGYALISILLQGWVISYMSFAVGWLVATAMMKASGGVGGKRYQIAAVLLTYAAVSMAAIPIWIYLAGKEPHRQTQQERLREEQRQLENDTGQSEQSRGHFSEPQPRPQLTLGVWLGRVALLGLASPFLQLRSDPFWGAMGLLILFVGIRIAWRIAAGKPLTIFGPFNDLPQSGATVPR
jgi:hypothetical protein